VVEGCSGNEGIVLHTHHMGEEVSLLGNGTSLWWEVKEEEEEEEEEEDT
jgi:hypothetical protein